LAVARSREVGETYSMKKEEFQGEQKNPEAMWRVAIEGPIRLHAR